MDESDRDRIARLEERVRRLEAQVAATPQWIPVPTPTRSVVPGPAAMAPARQPQTAAARPRPQEPPLFDWEKIMGANWLARAGVLVLALGVVFFLKLAYDNDWVPLWGRIAIGVVGGLAIFGLGEWLRQRKFDSTYTQILSGGGAIIAYISLYVAYALTNYRIALGIALPAEIVLLASCAMLLGGYALWRNLPVLAGVALGLVAVLVAPAGDFSTAGIIAVGVLGSAMLAAAAWRGWSSVLLTGLLAIDLAHMVAALQTDIPWAVTTASAVVVNVLAVVAAGRAKDEDPSLQRWAAGVAAVMLAGILAITLDAAKGVAHPEAWSLLAVGLASLGAALAFRRIAPAMALVGALMLLGWPFLHFPSSLYQTLALAGLAAFAFGASFAIQPNWVRLGASAAAGLGVLSLLILSESIRAVKVHPWQSAGLAFALAAVGVGLWVAERRNQASKPVVPNGGLIVAAALFILWPLRQFPDTLWQTLTFVLLAAGLGVAAKAWRPGKIVLRLSCCLLALIAVVSFFGLAATRDVVQATQTGAAAIAGLLVALGAFTWSTGRGEDDGQAVRVAGILVLATAPIIEFGYLLSGWGIAVSWGVEALALAALGLTLRDAEIRIASLGVFGIVIGRIFLVDFSTLNLASRVIAFLLVGGLLLVGAFLYARQRNATAMPPK